MNKQQRRSIDAIRTNAAVITSLVEEEQRRFSRSRKHTIEACYSSVVLHAHKLVLDVPRLGIFYHPDEYRANCEQMLRQIEVQYETASLIPARERAGDKEDNLDSTN